MDVTLLSGYPDFVGRRQIYCGYGNGPLAYSRTTRDVLATTRYVDVIFPSVSISGTYIVYGVAPAVGPRQPWALKWVIAATGVEVANNFNLSGETVQIGWFGGQY